MSATVKKGTTTSLHGTREASHQGSWYEDDPDELSTELDEYLSRVPKSLDGQPLPIPRARVIIGPHAGYSYSGPCAAWAYSALDLSKARRVFLLGPSHTYYLRGCALTTFKHYATPWGDLRVDADIMAELRATDAFADIPRRSDAEEHSLEMHLPYLWKRLEQTHHGRDDKDNGDQDRGPSSTPPGSWPTIVPMLVGDNNGEAEKSFGRLLLPYLRDPTNAFIVSSDFCHWGSRFNYTPYCPGGQLHALRSLSRRDARPSDPPIHASIKALDEAAIAAIESGAHDAFVRNLRTTKNTVCGRHPIGVMMAALEAFGHGDDGDGGESDASMHDHDSNDGDDSDDESAGSNNVQDGHYANSTQGQQNGNGNAMAPRFKFVRYEQSSAAEHPTDSSVSYASAYAVV